MRTGRAKDHDIGSHLDLLEAWLEAQRGYFGLPGAAIGIVHDQELVYANGIGYADIEKQTPCGPDTIYRIASHSKLFTAIAVMILRDARRLDLDVPISDYLSWYKPKEPNTRPITLRHLLAHRSGLPREAGPNYWVDFEFPDVDALRSWTNDVDAVFLPEERDKYSNLAFGLAGQVIEAVADVSYDDFVRKSILIPLEMVDSTTAAVSDPSRLATGYGRIIGGTRETMPFVDAGALASATGFSSTVSDMAKFVAWQFRLLKRDGHEVIKASTLREMQRVQWINPKWDGGRGIGFGTTRVGGRDLVGHSGGYPGYLTGTYVSLQEKVGVIAFTNALDAQPNPKQDRGITGRVFDWVAPRLAADAPQQADVNPEWRDYDGTYRNIWTDTLVLTLDGQLCMVCPYAADPKQDVTTLEPIEKDRFRMVSANGGGPVGEVVVFERDALGRVVAFQAPGRAEKIDLRGNRPNTT